MSNLSQLMVRALHDILGAARGMMVVVPRDEDAVMPAHRIVVEVGVSDGPDPLIKALHRNIGGIVQAGVPAEYVAVVDVRDLKTLIVLAKARLHSGAEIFTVEQMHARGVELLHGWSHQQRLEQGDD